MCVCVCVLSLFCQSPKLANTQATIPDCVCVCVCVGRTGRMSKMFFAVCGAATSHCMLIIISYLANKQVKWPAQQTPSATPPNTLLLHAHTHTCKQFNVVSNLFATSGQHVFRLFSLDFPCFFLFFLFFFFLFSFILPTAHSYISCNYLPHFRVSDLSTLRCFSCFTCTRRYLNSN